MKAFFVFLVLLFTAPLSVYAGTVKYQFSGLNVTREGGATYLRGTSPSEMAAAAVQVVGGVVTGSGAASVGGATATFSTSATLGSAAGNVLKTALRATPGILGVATISWLLSKGLEYANGQYTKSEQTSSPLQGAFRHAHDLSAGPFPSPQAACEDFRTRFTVYPSLTVRWGEGGYQNGCYNGAAASPATVLSVDGSVSCPSGTTMSGGSCVGTQKAQATETDWDSAGTPPDAVFKEALGNGIKLPADGVVSTPRYKDVNLGEPYIDPVTGDRVQDKARITPSSDGNSAEFTPFKQTVDSNGNPTTDPETGNDTKPQSDTDFCKNHPEASACKELGEPDPAEDMRTEERGVSAITQQAFASNASCPADIPLPKGTKFSFKWSCDMATTLKPLLIALAWLSAGLIVMGAFRDS